MKHKMNAALSAVTLLVMAANTAASAATAVTAAAPTASGFTTTQTQQAATTSQNVVDTKNALMAVAAVSANIPTAPANLTATVTAANKVSMTWSASTGGAYGVHGYNVYRDSAYVASTSGTYFTDQNAVLGKTYAYSVKAYDGSSHLSASSNSAAVSVGTPTPAPLPAPAPVPNPTGTPSNIPTAPSNLTATVNKYNKVSLTWTASTGGAYGVRGYNIYRDGAYVASMSGAYFTDESAVLGKSYAYSVKAYDGSSKLSLSSNVAAITVGAPAPAPLPSPGAVTLPAAGPGMLFSPSSIWNTKLSAAQPVQSNSVNLVNNLLYNTKLAAPWINANSWTTTYYVVDSSTAKSPVAVVQNGAELTWSKLHQDLMKGVPIPAGAVGSAGTDAEITIYDVSTDTLYDFWQFKQVNGRYQAAWGGILKNASTSNGVMPIVTNASGGTENWGATATGLPAIAGTIMVKELKAGVIPHALAFAIPYAKNTFVSPATRTDGASSDPNAIPEGTRFRFPADVYIDPNWTPIIKMMVTAVRDYGMILRDQAGAATFYAEDSVTYAQDPYPAFYGGKPLWDVIAQFPWGKLQAV